MESRRFRKDVLSFRLHRKQLFLPFLSMKRPVTIDIPRKNGFLFTLSVPPAYPPALYFGRPLSSAPFSGLIQNRRVRFSCARRKKRLRYGISGISNAKRSSSRSGRKCFPGFWKPSKKPLCGIIPAFPEPSLPRRFPGRFQFGDRRSDSFYIERI